jgi:hypothetical protein
MSLEKMIKEVCGRYSSYSIYSIHITKSKPKFVREEFKIDLSNVDVAAVIRKSAENMDYSGYAGPPHEHLSVGDTAPVENETVERFNLPITKK